MRIRKIYDIKLQQINGVTHYIERWMNYEIQ